MSDKEKSSGKFIRNILNVCRNYKVEVITFTVVIIFIISVITFGVVKFSYNVYVDKRFMGKVEKTGEIKSVLRKTVEEGAKEKKVSVYPSLTLFSDFTPTEEIKQSYISDNGVKRGVALSLDNELIFAVEDEQIILSVLNEYMLPFKDSDSIDAKIDAKVEIVDGYFANELFCEKDEAKSRILVSGKNVLVTRSDGKVLKNGIDEDAIWNMPVTAPVSSHFGERWGKLHEGTDFAANDGDPICAARGGSITYSGYSGGYGNLVIIDHGEGLETYYAHMSEICVSVGDKVKRGEQIGKVGNTGNSTGPHLHFEIRLDNVAQNPLEFMGI